MPFCGLLTSRGAREQQKGAASNDAQAAVPVKPLAPESKKVEQMLCDFVCQALEEVQRVGTQLPDHALDKKLAAAIGDGKSLQESLPQSLLSDVARINKGEEPWNDVESSIPSPDELKKQIRTLLRSAIEHADVKEADGSGLKHIAQTFQNWGRTVESKPSVTFIPKSKVGVCNIVKWASRLGLKVRVAGYRHSWSNWFPEDGQVLISLLPLNIVEDLPAKEPPIDPTNELQGIEIVGEVEEKGARKALCKIGSATTNEQFRRWVIDNACDKETNTWRPWWTVPLNVIMVEITWGGSNGPVCHGAGWKNQTLSDLVRSIEFVNANGEVQVVSDAEQLKSASGCFGMLGVVTSLTLALDVLTYANMKPTKENVALAIPPPKGFEVPENIDMSGITDAELDRAFEAFVKHCETDFYSEWFWFVLQDKVWVNAWKNDGDQANAVDYPSKLEAKVQAGTEYAAQLANMYLWPRLPASWQAHVMGSAGIEALPDGETVVTPLIDGLHFRRGIQNMRVYDMEWEIPIPGKKDDPSLPDWSICQDAWWAVISAFYRRYNANKDDVPMRLTMEMRITGDSNVNIAPQRGNRHGTCSIEILTPGNVDQQEFQQFMQEITDAWTQYKDLDGSYLNARPHWAKQWQGLNVRGMPVVSYLKDVACKDQIQDFGRGLAAVAAAGKFSMQDAKRLFSNDLVLQLFDSVYGPDSFEVEETTAVEVGETPVQRCWWQCC